MIVELSISTVSFIHLPYTFLSRKYNTFIDITGTHKIHQQSCFKSSHLRQFLSFYAAERTWSPGAGFLPPPSDPPPLLHPHPCGCALQVFAPSLRFKSSHFIKKRETAAFRQFLSFYAAERT